MKSYLEMGVDLVGLAEERHAVVILMGMLQYCMLSVGNFQLKFYPSPKFFGLCETRWDLWQVVLLFLFSGKSIRFSQQRLCVS